MSFLYLHLNKIKYKTQNLRGYVFEGLKLVNVLYDAMSGLLLEVLYCFNAYISTEGLQSVYTLVFLWFA